MPPHEVIGVPKWPDRKHHVLKSTLISWSLQEGDVLKANEMMCELDAAKATFEVTVPQKFNDAFLAKRLIPVGGLVNEGTALAVVCFEKKDLPSFADAPVTEFGAGSSDNDPSVKLQQPDDPKTVGKRQPARKSS